MNYITNCNIRANGTSYEKGSTFPSNLKGLDYKSLLNKGRLLDVTPPPPKKEKTKKPKANVKPEAQEKESNPAPDEKV